MSRERMNSAIVEGLQREGLIDLWDQIVADNAPREVWEPGRALEYLILRGFQLEGARVRWPFAVEIEGTLLEQIDGAVHTVSLACICESKDQAKPMNVDSIAKLRNQLLRRPSSAIGLFFSRSGFTDSALTLARFMSPQLILLWVEEEIDYCVRNGTFLRFLDLKHRHAIEEGMPDFNPISLIPVEGLS